MTGHQENPGSGLMLQNEPATKVDIEALCLAAGVKKVVKVDPYNIKETLAVFKEVMALDEAAVIIADAPCVIRARIKFSESYWVDTEKCIQ